jgi:hypothetical protein
MSNLTLHIDAPYISYEEYARRTGIPVGAIRKLVAEGRLPIRPKLKAQERPFINMLALAKEAADLAHAS